LKKNLSIVDELTNDFYLLSIHVDHQEIDEKLVARYMNCLKFSIQDELSMHRVHSVEEAYQLDLKVEGKKIDNFLKGIEEQGGVRRLPHWVVSNMAEVNHPKEMRKQNILDKVT
jgi:hypothetical protein